MGSRSAPRPTAFLAGSLLAALLGAFFLLAIGLPGRAQSPAEEQGALASFVSRLLSTPTSRVTIGQVEGALSSDATIRNVTVADEAGVYLSIDRIRLVWRRTALLQRRIEVERLEIGRIVLARRPVADPDGAEPGPILPELPLALRVDAFTLAELQLGEAVLGAPARLTGTGLASLGPPAQGLRAQIAIRRLDAPGQAVLDLAFTPQGERLDLALSLDEPEGGILVRLAGVPGEPPARLDLTGQGTLDDWRASLAFEGGPDLGATGAARIARTDGARLLTLDVAARIVPLLPPVIGPVFGGTTALTGGVRFGDDGRIGLEALRVGAARAELTVDGTLSPAPALPERVLSARASARALPSAPGEPPGDVRLERLVFEASAEGVLAAPRIQGALDLAGLASQQGALDALTARFALQPSGSGRLAFDGTAAARGFRPADPGLEAALGRQIDFVVRGDIGETGVARFEAARLASPTVALAYAGRLGRRLVDGRLTGEIIALEAFSRLAGRALTGKAVLDAALSGDPSRNRLTATLTGRTERLSLGDARLDRLLGEAISLSGSLRRQGGAIEIQALRVSGRALSAELDGRIAGERLDLGAAAALSDLSALDARLGGAAEARLRLEGAAADPDMAMSLAAAEARALGRPIRGLAIDGRIRQALSAPRFTVTGRGEIGGNPLALDASGAAAAAPGGRVWTLDRLAGSLGSVAVDAAGRLRDDGFAEGRATLRARDLDDLSPLVLTRLAGRIDADVSADTVMREGRAAQAFSMRAEGANLQADALRVASLDVDLTAQDLYVRPTFRGEARARGILAGSQRFDELAFTAREAREGETALVVQGRASGFDLSARAQLAPGPPVVARLDAFRAARNGRTVALAAPAELVLAQGGVRTEGVALDVAGGRLSLAGMIGPTLDLRAEIADLPLAAAEVFAPGLGLAGVADGRAEITGPASDPRGPISLELRGFSLPALRSSGAPPLGVVARGRLEADAVAGDATVRGGRAIDLTVAGSAGLGGAGALDLTVRGQLDAALANVRLAGSGQRLAGRVAVDATIGGSRTSPRVAGSATLANGSFTDAANGISLTAIEGRATGRDSDIVIERLSARAPNGGTLSLTGRIAADPARSFPADLRLAARQAQLVNGPVARLVANLDLAISGPLASAPRIAGRVGVVSLDVRVPERFGGAGAPLNDARHIAPPPQTRARLAQKARAEAGRRRGGPPFRAALDLAIDAPSRVFVRGRGLDAELGGGVRVTGTTLSPVALGAFEMRRGRLSILTQRLDFTRGRLTFGGAGFIPELDFLAETRAGDVTARVAVTGPADAPSFAFSSSPALPEDEVLARLLFQRAAAGLSAFQALQLAQAAAQLSGTGGPDAFEAARRALGVDDLDVNVSAGGPTVGISRAIGDRARIGVRAGARPESSGVGIDIDLTRRLRLQSEIGADGRASVGVGIEQEY